MDSYMFIKTRHFREKLKLDKKPKREYNRIIQHKLERRGKYGR